jgi:tetraacyldisaccharide 4'-kinase
MRFPEKLWQRTGAAHALLIPLGALYGLVSGLRRALYRAGVLKSHGLPAPVVIAGNITVGGSGKTPLVLWLAQFLKDQGWRPGIVSRGYRGTETGPLAVTPDSDPARTGDEPVLLARRSGCPVWVGRNRVATALALLASEPACNVILCDDGLQHYRLRRDMEIAVVDAERRFGNGRLLPAGPLREPLSRLRTVDAVVWNGGEQATGETGREFRMRLVGDGFRNLFNPGTLAGPGAFRGRRIHAVAGIGNPARFFAHLRELGLEGVAHAYPDHHAYRPEDVDFPDADAILMTEKDAVKCAAFANEKMWALEVDAEVDPGLGDAVLRKLRRN